MTLEQRAKKIISEQLGVPEGRVIKKANILDDLAADSLDTVELFLTIEEEFNIEIPDEESCHFSTVGDVLKVIQKKIQQNGEFVNMGPAVTN